MYKQLLIAVLLIALTPLLNGCLVAAVGAGAEAGYVASQKDRSAGETVSDQWITSKVKSQLLADPVASALRINVDTHKAIVTLNGTVGTQAEADRAVEIARSTKGVADVVSNLGVAKK